MVVLVINLNGKTEGRTKTLAEFKFDMLKRIRTDSLGTWHRLSFVVEETKMFIDGSPSAKKGIREIVMLLTFLVIIETGFVLIKKKKAPVQPPEM